MWDLSEKRTKRSRRRSLSEKAETELHESRRERLVDSRKREGFTEEGCCRRRKEASEMARERRSQARESHGRFTVAELEVGIGRRERRRDEKAASNGSERGYRFGDGKTGTSRCFSVRNMLI